MTWDQFCQKWDCPPDTVALQVPAELDRFMEIFVTQTPASKVIVEIGSMHGGTVWQWAKHSAKDATVIAVDLDIGLLAKSLSEFGDKIIGVQGASTSPETIAKVVLAADLKPIDFLFIDADHTGDNPLRDLSAYVPYLRTGALVAFHDVDCVALTDVGKCWKKLQAQYPQNRTFSVGQPEAMGIGCFWFNP